MKRIVSSLLSLLALSSLFTVTSCQKETVGNGTQFRATMEGCTSKDGKTALNGTALNWVAGDEIAVYGTAGRGIYTATPQTPATVALFDNVSGETGNAPFRAYYPTTLTTDGVHVTLPAVQTTADGSLTEFPMYAQSDDNTLAFRNLCGALKLHLTKAGVSVSSIEVSTNTPINGQYTLRYTGVPVIDYESNGTNSTVLECETPQPIANGKDFYIYLPHGNYTEMAFTITASDGSVCTKHSKANVAIYITRSQYTTINLGENDLEFVNSEDWVDLGLPSGLLWATRNVGATSPEDYGDYFAWGETTTKSVYDWTTYIYCNGARAQLTKYCNNSDYGYNGFTDNLTILQPGDDAATANYGGRTPTKEEWQELLNNTTSQWTTLNGVNGRLFTASNGNSLFLPAAGGRRDSSLYYAGGDGYYWSSSLTTDYPYRAWIFNFDSDGQRMYDGSGRGSGRSVRAVRSAQ